MKYLETQKSGKKYLLSVQEKPADSLTFKVDGINKYVKLYDPTDPNVIGIRTKINNEIKSYGVVSSCVLANNRKCLYSDSWLNLNIPSSSSYTKDNNVFYIKYIGIYFITSNDAYTYSYDGLNFSSWISLSTAGSSVKNKIGNYQFIQYIDTIYEENTNLYIVITVSNSNKTSYTKYLFKMKDFKNNIFEFCDYISIGSTTYKYSQNAAMFQLLNTQIHYLFILFGSNLVYTYNNKFITASIKNVYFDNLPEYDPFIEKFVLTVNKSSSYTDLAYYESNDLINWNETKYNRDTKISGWELFRCTNGLWLYHKTTATGNKYSKILDANLNVIKEIENKRVIHFDVITNLYYSIIAYQELMQSRDLINWQQVFSDGQGTALSYPDGIARVDYD